MDNKIKDIVKLKQIVDSADDKIVEQLFERKKLTTAILNIKEELGIQLKDENRENEIIERLIKQYVSSFELAGYDRNLISKLYKIIFKDSIRNHLLDYNRNFIKKIDEALHIRPMIIAGPCSVESNEQITRIAGELADLGIKFLRGGAFKPRTSPDSFQGIGDKGIEYLRKAADSNNMFVVTEVLSKTQLDKHYDHIDIIQIGSRNMASYGFLKEIGKRTASDKKPVLLKRGFNATLKEFLFAAKYIQDEGNPNIILCLRGIRTYEQIDSLMRYTPDLASIIELKEITDLPVIFDPSHSTGNSLFVKRIALAAINLGADGLLIETHFDPALAMSDSEQCIKPSVINEIMEEI